MLNPFPELLFLSQLGPFILRVVIGIIFLDLGILKLKGEKSRWLASFEALRLRPADLMLLIFASVEMVAGILLIVGLYTQWAALVMAVFVGIELGIEWKMREVLKRNLVFYLLLFTICLSLLVTGAGAFAFDIPL